ncbi:MAG TPA: hypothetical protein VLZ28_08825, partial [Daejeonella sp.]|nr:hypothetical protein [Daejeonella sp.]
EALSGSYDGECKKGKANGNGKAQGTDQYEGEFKDGLPNGEGVYQWKNGDTFSGAWIAGKRSGKGDMTFKRAGKTDSLVTGFWKRDVFAGKFEKPYQVMSRTLQVTKSDVKFEASPIREVVIVLSNTTGNMPTLGGRITAKAVLGEVNVSKGSYTRLMNLYDNNKNTGYKLENVTFPFRAKFRFGSQEVDVEFFEAGKFALEVTLNN